MKQHSRWTPPLESTGTKAAFWALLMTVLCGIASLQGYLSYDKENEFIDIQSDQTCQAVFNAVESGWNEVALFTETLAGAFYAYDIDVSQDRYTSLAQTTAVKSIYAMTSLQFVKHLEGMPARKKWEEDVKEEFKNNPLITDPKQMNTTADKFFMYGFGKQRSPNISSSNESVFDPIIYQTNWDPFLWGFYPDPEPPRIAAIQSSLKTGELSCSNQIQLFGHALNPAGMVCFLPLWTDPATGKAIPQKLANNTDNHAFGFLNPMFKTSDFLSNLIESDSFGTDISNIDIFMFDTLEDAEENSFSKRKKGSFLAKYPTTTQSEFEEIYTKGPEEVINEKPSLSTKTKVLTIGKREWTVYCVTRPNFALERRSNLPYLIGLSSVVVSLSVHFLKIMISMCIFKITGTGATSSKKVHAAEGGKPKEMAS